MRLTLQEMTLAVGAQADLRLDPAFQVTGAAIDSREVKPGNLFVCLPGERVDGHDFAAQAVERGASAVLAARPVDVTAPVLIVEDTVRAMAALGAYFRRQSGGRGLRVAAVTGSAGKTTVKEMLAQILGIEFSVAKNPGNKNNQIGLPLSILNASGDEDVWVMEVGISRSGDMEDLGPIVAPDLAVVHNIGPAHLEGLGSLAGVAKAKASLFSHLMQGGRGVVSADYPELAREAKAVLPEVMTFSCQGRLADFSCRFLGPTPDGRGRYVFEGQGLSLTCDLGCRVAHFAENVAAAAAGALLMGAGAEAIRLGLSEASLPAGRFACSHCQGWLVIDDTYNANPLSMGRAVASARELSQDRPLILVLGDMAELGGEAAKAHQELGGLIARAGCEAVFFVGAHFADVASGLAEAKFAGPVVDISEPDSFARELKGLGFDGGVALFKGSRSSRMERFVADFQTAIAHGGEV